MTRPFDSDLHPADARDGREEQSSWLTAELVDVLRSYALVVLGAAIVTAMGAWLLASMQTRRYRVAAIAVVAPMTESMTGDERIRAIQALDQRVIIATAAALASTPIVQAQAAPRTGVKGDEYSIRALPLPDTNLLRIEVEGRDVAKASEIANRMPAILSTQTQSIFHFFGVTSVSPAAEGELVAPRIGRTVAAGFVIGALLGLGLGWTLMKLRRAARTSAPSQKADPGLTSDHARADAEMEVLAGRPVDAGVVGDDVRSEHQNETERSFQDASDDVRNDTLATPAAGFSDPREIAGSSRLEPGSVDLHVPETTSYAGGTGPSERYEPAGLESSASSKKKRRRRGF